jgi:arsenite-transporting ATPase
VEKRAPEFRLYFNDTKKGYLNMKFIENATKNLFFTGKGGVGKTSLSCSTAIALADSGKKVLLVSTDPASNLDEVLGTTLTGKPTPITGVSGLFALNIDPEESARQYREKIVAPYRGVLPDAAVKSIEEQLSGACTVGIAAFDEFSRLLGDESATKEYDHIIFDTAPTGHTLRLLELPTAWTGYIETNTSGTTCLGPLAGLKEQQALYKNTLMALSDSSRTTIVLVSRPEKSALKEAERTRTELAMLGITNQRLILNGIFNANDRNDPVARALEEKGRLALRTMPMGLSQIPITEVPLMPFGLVGIARLHGMLDNTRVINTDIQIFPGESESFDTTAEHLTTLIDELSRQGKGVVMTMGKGGVGKTTLASAIAVELARRGHQVHLSTTDPAAHVDVTLADKIKNLTVSRIDPETEVNVYKEEVMRSAGSSLDEQGRKLLEEDLRSPCTEEIAVFRAFARIVDEGKDGFVVLDTAPTGHTLLLLDAAESYHREVTRTMSDMPQSVRELLPRLRDRDFTKIFLVTLPEATPVHEAAQLQKDLKRADIEPFAWIINQSMAPLDVADPVLMSRKSREARFINEVKIVHAKRVALVPWMQDENGIFSWMQKAVAV